MVAGETGEVGNPGTLPRHAGAGGMTKRRGSLKGKEPLPVELFFCCRFNASPFDVPVESGIHSEGDNDHAIHDADDPQGI